MEGTKSSVEVNPGELESFSMLEAHTVGDDWWFEAHSCVVLEAHTVGDDW